MNKIEQIKAEIERRNLKGKSYYPAMLMLLDIIASLPEQPSEDLEKAAEEYANSIAQFDMQRIYSRYDFKAGAEWQKEQMMKDAVETTMIEGSLDNPTFVRRKIIIVKEG